MPSPLIEQIKKSPGTEEILKEALVLKVKQAPQSGDKTEVLSPHIFRFLLTTTPSPPNSIAEFYVCCQTENNQVNVRQT